MCARVSLDIMTGQAERAFDLYREMDMSTESLMLLDFIANECYKVRPALLCH